MKALIIILLMFIGYFSLPAQDYYQLHSRASLQLEISAYGRRSILGNMSGVNIGIDINNRWNFSYIQIGNVSQNENAFGSNQYQGIEASYAINPKNPLRVGLGIEGGFYNNYYFALHPSIQIEYAPESNYFMVLGVSKSDGFPLFNLKVGAVIFKK